MLVVQAMYFMLPAYIANMFPVLAKNSMKCLDRPVDCGLKLRGRPLFGSHKTIRGLLVGVLAGIIVFQVQKWLYSIGFFQSISLVDYNEIYASWRLLPGLLLGLGALAGDMIESFFKRQFRIKPGRSWIPFDQIDFIIGALLLVSIVYAPSWQVILILMVLTPLIHIGANHLGYHLNLKKEKW
mgnify:CR=1 FL=1